MPNDSQTKTHNEHDNNVIERCDRFPFENWRHSNMIIMYIPWFTFSQTIFYFYLAFGFVCFGFVNVLSSWIWNCFYPYHSDNTCLHFICEFFPLLIIGFFFSGSKHKRYWNNTWFTVAYTIHNKRLSSQLTWKILWK